MTKSKPSVFDENDKFHEKDTNAAVIREEFLNNFEIKTPLIYDSLCKYVAIRHCMTNEAMKL